MLSSTNSLRRDKYVFQPKRYDDNDNIICALSKRTMYKNGKKFFNKDKCKLTEFMILKRKNLLLHGLQKVL